MLAQPVPAGPAVWRRVARGTEGCTLKLRGLGLSRKSPTGAPALVPCQLLPGPAQGRQRGFPGEAPGTVTHSSRSVFTEPTSPHPQPPGSPPEGRETQILVPCSPGHHAQLSRGPQGPHFTHEETKAQGGASPARRESGRVELGLTGSLSLGPPALACAEWEFRHGFQPDSQ